MFCVLNFASKGVDDVDQIVALRKHLVDFFTAITKLASKSISDSVLNDLWMRLIANTVYVFFRDDIVEARCRGLQIVQSISHVALCSENERLDSLFIALQTLHLYDLL